jgi:16S rRNA (cytosine1402-N4)-methyltransferase
MTVVDGTLGAGGHAVAFAAAIRPGGLLIGIDQDAEILEHARRALASLGGDGDLHVVLEHASYAEIEEVLSRAGVGGCDRVFLDLGVSSLQLDSPQRGFSFMRDGPLDMRMDQARNGISAARWLQSVAEPELERVLRDYGGERHARRIARAIVEQRRRHPLDRTAQLADLIVRALPSKARHGRVHAATRSFQAIRIAVNDELGTLERGLAAAERALRPAGKLVVLTFHSAEDRIVKHFLRDHFELPFRKPVSPSAEECASNPRARSAKLRCGIKRREAA